MISCVQFSCPLCEVSLTHDSTPMLLCLLVFIIPHITLAESASCSHHTHSHECMVNESATYRPASHFLGPYTHKTYVRWVHAHAHGHNHGFVCAGTLIHVYTYCICTITCTQVHASTENHTFEAYTLMHPTSRCLIHMRTHWHLYIYNHTRIRQHRE